MAANIKEAAQFEQWRKHLVGRLVRKLNQALMGYRLSLTELHPAHNPSGYADSFDRAMLEVEDDGNFFLVLKDYTTGVKVRVEIKVEEIE